MSVIEDQHADTGQEVTKTNRVERGETGREGLSKRGE